MPRRRSPMRQAAAHLGVRGPDAGCRLGPHSLELASSADARGAVSGSPQPEPERRRTAKRLGGWGPGRGEWGGAPRTLERARAGEARERCEDDRKNPSIQAGVPVPPHRARVDGGGRVGPAAGGLVRAAVDQERRVARIRCRSEGHAILAPGSDQRLQLQQARGRVALQDRQPRPASRIQAGRHAAHGQGRRVHDRRHAPVGRRARRQDRRADLGAQPARRQARRHRAAAALGPRTLVLDRRQGRRPHPLS